MIELATYEPAGNSAVKMGNTCNKCVARELLACSTKKHGRSVPSLEQSKPCRVLEDNLPHVLVQKNYPTRFFFNNHVNRNFLLCSLLLFFTVLYCKTTFKGRFEV